MVETKTHRTVQLTTKQIESTPGGSAALMALLGTFTALTVASAAIALTAPEEPTDRTKLQELVQSIDARWQVAPSGRIFAIDVPKLVGGIIDLPSVDYTILVKEGELDKANAEIDAIKRNQGFDVGIGCKTPNSIKITDEYGNSCRGSFSSEAMLLDSSFDSALFNHLIESGKIELSRQDTEWMSDIIRDKLFSITKQHASTQVTQRSYGSWSISSYYYENGTYKCVLKNHEDIIEIGWKIHLEHKSVSIITEPWLGLRAPYALKDIGASNVVFFEGLVKRHLGESKIEELEPIELTQLGRKLGYEIQSSIDWTLRS